MNRHKSSSLDQYTEKLNECFIRASYNRRLVLFTFTREATTMRMTISVIVLMLLPANWALAVSTTTVSFQNGLSGYSGTFDRYIAQTPDSGIDGSALPDVTLIGNSQQGLIRFDNIFGGGAGQIPLGARILDASLQLSTIGGADANLDGTNGPYTVAGLTSAFDSTFTFGSTLR